MTINMIQHFLVQLSPHLITHLSQYHSDMHVMLYDGMICMHNLSNDGTNKHRIQSLAWGVSTSLSSGTPC